MRRLTNSYYLLLILTLNSCLKEETPLPKPKPGNIETVVIEIGFPYLNQVYYDCETNKITGINTKYDWDLSFECSPTGFHVLLNNATGMLAANMENASFSSVNSTSGVTWLWDNPNGNLDSTAIGNWVGTNNVYVIDRQFDDNGNHRGYKKIELQSVDLDSYTIRYASLDGSNENTLTINKNNTRNFIHFTFNNTGQVLLLEP